MNGNEEFTEIVKFVSKDINKIGIKDLPETYGLHSLNELKKYLTVKISELLDTNYTKLLNTLYLIDLDERKLHDLFSGKNREIMPQVLADLIIERQVQKFNNRKKYREGEI
jgi:hypothetical protein